MNPLVTTELLRAMSKSGNYVAGAFRDDDLVGACVGFFCAPADEAMHSHIAGVSAHARGRSVGFALKVHQRAWALLRGVSEISWTFDPLVRRNAYFNLAKLGAAPVEYLPDFYGGMHDAINSGDDTDRLLVRWSLGDDRVRVACLGRPALADVASELSHGGVVALGVSDDGSPVAGSLDGRTLLVAVPADIERLRSTDPTRARLWRSALREVLTALVHDGALITGFDRAGWYVVSRRAAPDPETVTTRGEG